MTDSTVKDLSALSAASPVGLQATDLFYVLRPGAPDADFSAAGSDLSAFVGDILSAWTGGAAITTLGTVTAGAWQGTAIADGYIAGAAGWDAKIGGSTGASDNRLLRADGAGGATAQASGVTVSDNAEISGFLTLLNAQTGTTYTLAAADAGTTITCSNAAAVTVTLPDSLPAGFTCEVIQLGAGQVSFSAAGGATLNNRQSQAKIAGQHGAVRLTVVANSGGSSAVYNLAGDTGA